MALALSRDLIVSGVFDKSPLSLPAQSNDISTTSSDLEEKVVELTDKNRVLAATLSKLTTVDCDNLSPRQAFDLVWNFKKKFDKSSP